VAIFCAPVLTASKAAPLRCSKITIEQHLTGASDSGQRILNQTLTVIPEKEIAPMRMKFLSVFALLSMLAGCAEEQRGMPVCGCTPPHPGGTQEDLRADAGERVYFDYDMSSLTDSAKATLDRQVVWLRKYDTVGLVVAGSADERGSTEYNLAIGQRRAEAVKFYLLAKGIDARRIATISFGKERPVAEGSNEAAWAQNRNALSMVR
jgi:peptidoglycan-associated lipoprotein